MAENIQIAAFRGGALETYGAGTAAGEIVLSLPLARVLSTVVRVSYDMRETLEATALADLKSLNPYPDDELTPGVEVMAESESSVCAFAAALPESAADDIGEALDAAKANPVRIDLTSLGALRCVYDANFTAPWLFLYAEDNAAAAYVVSGAEILAARSIPFSNDFKRETMRLLLEAEARSVRDFSLGKIVACGEIPSEALAAVETFAPVERSTPSDEQIFEALASRAREEGTLDILPAAWRQMLEDTRFKSKLVKSVAIAVAIWAAIMGVLFGVPLVYGFMTDHQKALSREHAGRYREVREMREKVRLVQKYSDHARGALEILKAVSDRMPEGVELNNWNFKREDGVRFSGEADDAAAVYRFKDALLAMRFGDEEDETAERVFADVILTGPSAARGGRQKFDIDCKFQTEEE